MNDVPFHMAPMKRAEPASTLCYYCDTPHFEQDILYIHWSVKTIECAWREENFPEVMTVYSRLNTHTCRKFHSFHSTQNNKSA